MSHNLSFFQNNIVTLSNKQKRRLKKVNTGLRIKEIEPMTKTQERVFNSYYSGKNIMCHGVAGTGKTFIATYLATQEVLSNYNDTHSLHIIRSVVPTRDMGFLPIKEKNQKCMKHLTMQSLLNCLKEVMLMRYSKDVSKYTLQQHRL